jgi:lysyl-tRNA synthetase class 2
VTDETQHHAEESDLRQVKLDKLAALRGAGLDPYAQVRFDRTHSAAEVVDGFDALEGQEVAVAGRIMARRVHGKAGFADLQDGSGRVQLYFKKDTIGEDSFERYSALDLGDIVGAKGIAFRTRTGQPSVEVRDWVLLSKIIETLPEKFHRLTDVEQRYRQRYVDLIMNREVMERMTLRSRAVSAIRRFLDGRGFLEVETPMLHAIAGGATAEPFVTHWNVLKADYYLRIAIELHLKRLIVGGFERVYEIGRVFRNEGLSTRHNPEFTMLELYWAYTDYEDIMRLTEELVVHLAETVFGARDSGLDGDAVTQKPETRNPNPDTYTVQFGDHTLNFSTPFRRLSFEEAMVTYAGVSLTELTTLSEVRAVADRIGVPLSKDKGFEASLDEIFKERVEPHLIQPTFIYDYPKGLSPLAKSISAEDMRARGYDEHLELCYRFELFMASMEVANSFSELNDPLDQRERMEAQVRDQAEGIREVDEDFVTALEFAMPPTGGLGIGIDRLMMLLSGTEAIREVILFPQLRKG